MPGNIPEKWRTIARRIVPAAGAVVDGHRIHRDRRGVCGDFQGGTGQGLLIIWGRPIADNKGIFRAGGQAGKYRADAGCCLTSGGSKIRLVGGIIEIVLLLADMELLAGVNSALVCYHN